MKAREAMTELDDLEAKLGHRFTHPALLEQALTHGSVRHEHQTSDAAEILPAVQDNERLEFLGDAIVGMVVAELLYRRFPELDEGSLTRLRAALVSRKHLGHVGTELDLGSYLRLGRAEERNGGRQKAVLLANCVEALIGALYLEDGLLAAAGFIERTVVHPYMDQLRGDLRENPAIGDYKTALQELLQARRAGQPDYTVKAESGPDHRKRFLVQVRASHGENGSRAEGEGSTKKKAEQEAARQLYEQLKGHRPDSSNNLEQPNEPSPAVTSPAGYSAPSQDQRQPGPVSSSPPTPRPSIRASTKKPKGTYSASASSPISLTQQAHRGSRARATSAQPALAPRSRSSRPGSRNNPS
jgi:ribonuclease-3